MEMMLTQREVFALLGVGIASGVVEVHVITLPECVQARSQTASVSVRRSGPCRQDRSQMRAIKKKTVRQQKRSTYTK